MEDPKPMHTLVADVLNTQWLKKIVLKVEDKCKRGCWEELKEENWGTGLIKNTLRTDMKLLKNKY